MPRRLDVELTSARDDGSWTWRAAGAREPRGVLDGALLPRGSKVGDELRAEADFDLDWLRIAKDLRPHKGRGGQKQEGLRRKQAGMRHLEQIGLQRLQRHAARRSHG